MAVLHSRRKEWTPVLPSSTRILHIIVGNEVDCTDGLGSVPYCLIAHMIYGSTMEKLKLSTSFKVRNLRKRVRIIMAGLRAVTQPTTDFFFGTYTGGRTSVEHRVIPAHPPFPPTGLMNVHICTKHEEPRVACNTLLCTGNFFAARLKEFVVPCFFSDKIVHVRIFFFLVTVS